MADVAKFLFLYLEFYFAYIYTYWLVFGGTQDLQTLDESFYFVFRISVNDEWNTEQLEVRDPFLTYIIIGTHIGLTSFLCFSIFVALMDNTYMRVYENLNANVLMERVKIILQVEKNWSTRLHREALQSFIQDNCAPLTLRYNRMRNQRQNIIPFGEIEERKLVESVLRIKEMVNNCTNVITGIPKKNEAESMSYFVQQGQQSKSKNLAVLQKHLSTVQQELEVLQSQQEIIDEELQNDMDRLKEAVQKMCELHQNRAIWLFTESKQSV
ncbi:uncharacterized protein [Chiloscyllium punctatum]|uniref:uncharacterized protein n=1 Tax=Chiloscyllium punctatum TaxID=137246 RepID=UPI003B6329CC